MSSARDSYARDVPLWLNLSSMVPRWVMSVLCQLSFTGFMPMASQKRNYRNSNLNYWSCSLISKILLPSTITKMCDPFSGPSSKCYPIVDIVNAVVKYCEPNQRKMPVNRAVIHFNNPTWDLSEISKEGGGVGDGVKQWKERTLSKKRIKMSWTRLKIPWPSRG